MNPNALLHLHACAAICTASLCAGAPNVPVPDLPLAIRAPAGETLALEIRATGVQIYECAVDPEHAGRAVWTFKAPQADLYDRDGRRIGSHYAGPTWEALDGSKVVGAVRGRLDAPTAGAIPWLLLATRSTAKAGRFSATSSIQRLATAGGTAPGAGCTEATLGAQRRVPYTAIYYFYEPEKAAGDGRGP